MGSHSRGIELTAECAPANVPIDSEGNIRLSSEQLSAAMAATTGLAPSGTGSWVAAGHRLVRVVAYTPPAAIPASLFGGLSYCEASAVVEGPQAERGDVRVDAALQRPFPAGSACVERSPVVPCFGDGAKLWAEFSSAKVQHYSQLACRELAFFCYCHDPSFFRTAVLPSLQLRLPSYQCCLDAWMAGSRGRQLLSVWSAPHRYLALTPLERILLAWEEDSMEAQLLAPSAPLPRLARLAADMRSRLQRRAAGPGAAAAAEVSRRRFELALNGPGEGERDGGAGADRLQVEAAAFEDFQEWAEAGWFRQPPSAEPQDPDMLSPESDLWAALAEHLSRGGDLAPKHTQFMSSSAAANVAAPAFLPRRLDSAGWSFTDALLATAVLAITAAAPTVAYVRQTIMVAAGPGSAGPEATGESGRPPAGPQGAAGLASGFGRVVLLQRLLDPNMDPSELPRQPVSQLGGEGVEDADGVGDEGDEYEGAETSPGGDGVEIPPSSPLVAGRVYCYSITATNSSPSIIRIDIALQAPQGAVALGGRPALCVVPVELPPYGTHQLPLYYFYFPAVASVDGGGDREYDAYPAAASSRGRLLALAVGQWRSLKDVGRVAWRCGQDATFWRAALDALKRRHIWNEQIWSYAVLHRSPEALSELLSASSQLRAVLGPELNAAAEDAWKTLLRRMAAVAAAGRQPSTEDLLAAAYHLVLQDRPSEAQSLVGRIRDQIEQPMLLATPATEGRLQLCYLRAWLTLADPAATAPELRAAAAAVHGWYAAPTEAEPVACPGAAGQAGGAAPAGMGAVAGSSGGRAQRGPMLEPKWLSRLAELEAALEEAASIAAWDGGGSSGASQARSQSAVLVGLPQAAPRPGAAGHSRMLLQNSPDLRGVAVLEAEGVDTVVLNAYDLDLELLFSARPFDPTLGPNSNNAAGSMGNFALVRAPRSVTLDVKRLLGATAEDRSTFASIHGPAVTLLPPWMDQGGLFALSSGRINYFNYLSLVVPPGGSGGGGGAVLLEACGTAGGNGFLRSLLTIHRCDMRVHILEGQGVVKVSMLDGAQPVAGVYVKAYIKVDMGEDSPAEFHKDGYTDRRGFMDYWNLTRKPSAKVHTISLLVSHPQLGSTVLRVQPPAH
ncbi:Actin-binding protein F [Tetrabaena socialis]|uniref:Actin-binding protein F n=1 Tax=Tetrabaena socialis TaxID=47790 RepID=A0A2J7ZWZ2_9CHLO|nr:Actin-binding protein F [Tetrabaena socialis]|eukprot:PNH04772.1 Actin-binding protein F [Tetrabaena socialis]